MVKLNTTEIASIDGEFFDKMCLDIGSDAAKTNAQMVLRETTGTGAVFVDDKEKPKFCMFLLVGTYGVEAERVCVILNVYGAAKNLSPAALAAKQYARDNFCGKIGGGTFSGDLQDELWQHFDTDETQTIHFQKL